MTAENGNKRTWSKREANKQLRRIADFYLLDTIPDDGITDALTYATTLMNYSREWEIEEQYERWSSAFEQATREQGRSYYRLRKEILEDSRTFLEAGKADTHLNEFGLALENLANSF